MVKMLEVVCVFIMCHNHIIIGIIEVIVFIFDNIFINVDKVFVLCCRPAEVVEILISDRLYMHSLTDSLQCSNSTMLTAVYSGKLVLNIMASIYRQ